MTIKQFVWSSILKRFHNQENEVVITRKVGEAVFNRFVSEDAIRLEAYHLWEKAGKEGNREDFWLKAKDKIRNYIEQNG